MGAKVKPLGLYDLLAPHFLAGVLEVFPDFIDKYLSTLAVGDVQTTSDANSVLYTGTVFFPSAPGDSPVLQHRDPSGKVFDIKDLTLSFRLLVPRAGSPDIKTALDDVAIAFQPLKDVADTLGAQSSTPTDFPGLAFQLELLLSGLQFHLGDTFRPAKLAGDSSLVADPDAKSDDVRIVLPKVLMRYKQGQDFSGASFELASWGNPGFDAPNDLSEGELATMEPPLAIRRSGRWGFGIEEVVVDLSENGTPPEILDHFGEDESFEGVYVKLLQVYVTDEDKDFAFNFAIRDALISFSGDYSFEAEVDLLFDTLFTVDVRIYDGKNKVGLTAGKDDNGTKGIFTGGKATIPASAVIYLQVTGGIPPFAYSVAFTPDGGSEQELWSDAQRQAKLSPAPTANQHGTLVIQVTDSAPTPHTYKNTLDLTVTVAAPAPADTPSDTRFPLAHWNPDPPAPPPPGTSAYEIRPDPDFPLDAGTQVVLDIIGGPTLPSVTVAGTPYPLDAQRKIIFDVNPGDTAAVEVDYPGSALGNEFHLFFDFNKPADDAAASAYVTADANPDDSAFRNTKVPGDVSGGENLRGAPALRFWVQNALDLSKPISIAGLASNEGLDGNNNSNQQLSQRRADIANTIVSGVAGATVVAGTGLGTSNSTTSRPEDRVARILGTAKSIAPYKLTGKVTRDPNPQTTPPAAPAAPTPPSPPANKKPGFIRRLGARARFEHRHLVLAEFSGEVDFETDSEAALRNATGSTGTLDLKPTAAATAQPNPSNGLTDFTLTVTEDVATNEYVEDLKLGAAPADIDGLLRMTNEAPFSRLKDTLGAVLVFTPILNAATDAIDPDSAGEWTAIAVDLGVPAAIGALGFLHATEVTLFGGELVLRENIPDGVTSTQFTNASVTFDYSVAFRIDVNALDIHSSGPMKVRYKAVGVNLHFGDPPKVEFVLDTSKGYSLDLSDPSLFNLPAPLGNLLKVAAARIARFNPLTLELDLEIKADLGIVTVDKFQVKIPLDGSSSPMILPSGIKVNIPSAIVGSGSVKIDSGGFQGTIDVTLVPLKLRMAASVGVEHISQPPREATAFFLGLELDFPAPIILGASGLGLFGLYGLFGLNYERVLDPVPPTDPVGPDLRWLMKTGGTPYKLDNGGVPLWTPTLDNWAFGVGVLLGTTDGFLLNLRGMFILELPGPRVLITVNVQIVEDLPGHSPGGMDATKLDVGIIGILDIDVGAGTITLGVMIALEVKKLVTIQIPIQVFFDTNNTANWHVWIGTIQSPASAKVLGVVRGTGYFMAGGQAITPFPPDSTGSLPGVAVAVGVSAPIVWGSEDIDIYLKVVVSADLGVSFTPHLFIVGNVHVEGELRLVIVSVGASGDFTVTAPDPFFLKVHICGKVSFFFFDISACVDFATAQSPPLPPPPPPLFSKMYLQSFAPVIASGQGGERPIDASLGDASDLAHPGTVPVVPIDSVPVVQMLFGVDASTVTQTFTSPIPACPTFPGGSGVSLGGGRTAHYKLREVLIDPPLPGGEVPPAVWRPNKPTTDTSQTQVDLALFSRNPNVTNSALERSSDLSNLLISIWGDACTPPAPPACVFWAFCGQRLGPSPDGWTLFGTPLPDPPNTQRTSPVPTEMTVEQPTFTGADKLLMDLALQLIGEGLQAAQVAGPGSIVPHIAASATTGKSCFRAVELPELLSAAFNTQLSTALDPSHAQSVLSNLKAEVLNSRWLRFHTGLSNRVRMLFGIDPNLFKTSQGTNKTWFLIRERDAKGTLVRETPLVTMNVVLVNAVTGLPSTWVATGSPWGLAATQVFSFLTSLKLAVVLLEFKPTPTTTTIEVAVTAPVARVPTLLVGAVESCPTSESDRFNNGVEINESTIKTIEGYLDGGTPVPLLQKDTLYTVTLDYDVTVTEPDGSTSDVNGITQAWQFRTDNKTPSKLDPWVLCTAPDMNEQHVFYEDPVDVVFNDNSILQLFAQYGFKVKMDLRAADGLPEPADVDVTTVGISGMGPATYDALQQLIAEGRLPCVGATASYQNQVFTAPVKLRPTMGYTLDLVTDPSQLPPPDPNTPITPLFRRTFSTSKYPNMKALADDLGATRVSHRGLKSRLNFTTLGGKDVRPDQDIQDLFLAAGEQALPAPGRNRIVIYWAPATPNGPSVPHAILIDCTEPLWRTRPEPTFSNPIATDPTFRIATIGAATSLEVIEQGGADILAFLVSPGGTRTVAVLKPAFSPPPGGATVTLALHRPASSVYGNADESDVIAGIQIAPTAPWENDHV